MIKKLSNLTTKKNIRTFSVSPENLTGEKGKGGMATYGSASYAARELGQGWKMNPYLVSEAGSTLTLAGASGTLRPTILRSLFLHIYKAPVFQSKYGCFC